MVHDKQLENLRRKLKVLQDERLQLDTGKLAPFFSVLYTFFRDDDGFTAVALRNSINNTIIAIFWMSSSQKAMMRQISQCLHVDTTYGVSDLYLPLLQGFVRNQDGRLVCVFQALVHSETKEILGFMLSTAITESKCAPPAVVMTDRCPSFAGGIVLYFDDLEPKPDHQVCTFHLAKNIAEAVRRFDLNWSTSKARGMYNDFQFTAKQRTEAAFCVCFEALESKYANGCDDFRDYLEGLFAKRTTWADFACLNHFNLHHRTNNDSKAGNMAMKSLAETTQMKKQSAAALMEQVRRQHHRQEEQQLAAETPRGNGTTTVRTLIKSEREMFEPMASYFQKILSPHCCGLLRREFLEASALTVEPMTLEQFDDHVDASHEDELRLPSGCRQGCDANQLAAAIVSQNVIDFVSDHRGEAEILIYKVAPKTSKDLTDFIAYCIKCVAFECTCRRNTTTGIICRQLYSIFQHDHNVVVHHWYLHPRWRLQQHESWPVAGQCFTNKPNKDPRLLPQRVNKFHSRKGKFAIPSIETDEEENPHTTMSGVVDARLVSLLREDVDAIQRDLEDHSRQTMSEEATYEIMATKVASLKDTLSLRQSIDLGQLQIGAGPLRNTESWRATSSNAVRQLARMPLHTNLPTRLDTIDRSASALFSRIAVSPRVRNSELIATASSSPSIRPSEGGTPKKKNTTASTTTKTTAATKNKSTAKPQPR